MKKLVSLILLIIYFSIIPCFAYQDLYLFKNVTANQVNSIIENKFAEQGFSLLKKNPYYGVSDKNSSEAIIIITQQSGNDLYYYYSSDTNKKFNTNLLKYLRAQNISYEVSQQPNAVEVFDGIAQDILKNAFDNRYSFKEEEPVVYSTKNSVVQQQQQQQPQYQQLQQQQQQQQQKNKNTLYGSVLQVASGSNFGVYLNNPINTSTAKTGEAVTAVLTADWVYSGYVVAPQGSLVYGVITLARAAQYGSRNGKVVIDFNKLVTPDGQTYQISTDKVDFSVTNDGKLKSSIEQTVTKAVVGALAGLVLASIFGNSNTSLGKATAIGAGVGAGTAVIGAVAERGVDAEIPSFTELELTLTKPFTISKSSKNGEY